jgi:hypothetical protein
MNAQAIVARQMERKTVRGVKRKKIREGLIKESTKERKEE